MPKLSRRELERRMDVLIKAIDNMKNNMKTTVEASTLIAAKLYNLSPEEEIFSMYDEKFLSIVKSVAEGLKKKDKPASEVLKDVVDKVSKEEPRYTFSTTECSGTPDNPHIISVIDRSPNHVIGSGRLLFIYKDSYILVIVPNKSVDYMKDSDALEIVKESKCITPEVITCFNSYTYRDSGS